jgi:hypothetical protein
MPNDLQALNDFRMTLMREGISYDSDDIQYLFAIAKHCAKAAGVPVGAAGGLMTMNAGAVAIPLVGAVPGWVAGALAGFVGGTAACVMGRGALKPALDQILESRSR